VNSRLATLPIKLPNGLPRARAGIAVRALIDFAGSFILDRSFFQPLLEANGRLTWFHPIDFKQWPYFDHCSHRKLLIIDWATDMQMPPQ
jgi:cardiolipin synthase